MPWIFYTELRSPVLTVPWKIQDQALRNPRWRAGSETSVRTQDLWRATSLQRGKLEGNVNVRAERENCLSQAIAQSWKKRKFFSGEFISRSLPSQRRNLKIYYLYAGNPKGKIKFQVLLRKKITLGGSLTDANTKLLKSLRIPTVSKIWSNQNDQKHKNKPPGKNKQTKQRFRFQVTQIFKLSERKYKISENRRGHMLTKTLT